MAVRCMMEYKAVTLAVSLCSVLNWTPCILSIAQRQREKPQQMSVGADILKRDVTDEYKAGMPSPVSGTSQPYLDFHNDNLRLFVSGWGEEWRDYMLTSDSKKETPWPALFFVPIFPITHIRTALANLIITNHR
jgi:hypothetical protein